MCQPTNWHKALAQTPLHGLYWLHTKRTKPCSTPTPTSPPSWRWDTMRQTAVWLLLSGRMQPTLGPSLAGPSRPRPIMMRPSLIFSTGCDTRQGGTRHLLRPPSMAYTDHIPNEPTHA